MAHLALAAGKDHVGFNIPIARGSWLASSNYPAALSFRFGFGTSGATGDDGSDDFLDSAHRFRWASPMRFRAAALIFRRLPFGTSGAAAVAVGPPWSIWRSSAI